MNFYETVRGRRFYDADVPAIANALKTLAGKRSVEYDLIPETELISAAGQGWRFVSQLQSGSCLVERCIN